MNVKDKIIFGLLIVLLAAGGYFQWMADDMKSRMDELNKNDQEHLDVIDREFREDLRNLNLRFEGRGKHIRKAQEDIISNTNLINEKASELSDMIEEVQYNLDEYTRITDKKLERTNNDIADLQDSFDSQNRQNRRKFSDLEQTITQIQNTLKEMQEPEEEEDGKGKKRR
jgi:methyl-accepting chemotaxis protein